MRIAIDTLGADLGSKRIAKGAMQALSRSADMELVLIGDQAVLGPLVESDNNDRVSIVHTIEKIETTDKPVMAIRRKKEASMVKGYQLLKEGKCDALVSCGNTGALLAGGLFLSGRIKGIERPALTPVIPTRKGPRIMLDAGANVDCKAKFLLQFAQMGKIYSERVFNTENVRVGLLNIGAEPGKGSQLYNEAYGLMEAQMPSFIGNVEARDVLDGNYDVLVADGFAGNVLLKSVEGAASTLFGMLKEALTASLASKAAALVLRGPLRALRDQFDYHEVGGAPLLGIQNTVIKAHGSSDETAMMNAALFAERFAKSGVVEGIKALYAEEETK
jgi:glycerol-3-phosphate acyltransferase PlsX